MARKKNTTVTQGESTVATVTPGKKGKSKTAETAKLNVIDRVELKPSQLSFVEKFFKTRGDRLPDEIRGMADSLRIYGQQQPIQVRKSQNGYEVIFGHNRKLAADLLEAGYKTVSGNNQEKEVPANPEFTLRCEVVDITDDEAFRNNIIENARRQAVDPIATARNHQTLRDDGMSDAEITRMCGYASQATVTRLKDLLQLETEFQESIIRGDLTQGAANFLWDNTEKGTKEDRDAIYLKAVDFAGGNGGEGIGLSAMKKAVTAWKKERAEQAATQTATKPAGEVAGPSGGEGSAPATGGETGSVPASPAPAPVVAAGAKAKTIKEVKDFLKELGGGEGTPQAMVNFSANTLKFLAGEMTDEAYAEYVYTSLKFVEVAIPEDAGSEPVTEETPA